MKWRRFMRTGGWSVARTSCIGVTHPCRRPLRLSFPHGEGVQVYVVTSDIQRTRGNDGRGRHWDADVIRAKPFAAGEREGVQAAVTRADINHAAIDHG